MANQAIPSSAPLFRLPYAGITAAVFRKDVQNKAGKKVALYNVSLSRGYIDEKGERQYTSSLRYEDLLAAAHALSQAYEQITRVRKAGEDKPAKAA